MKNFVFLILYFLFSNNVIGQVLFGYNLDGSNDSTKILVIDEYNCIIPTKSIFFPYLLLHKSGDVEEGVFLDEKDSVVIRKSACEQYVHQFKYHTKLCSIVYDSVYTTITTLCGKPIFTYSDIRSYKLGNSNIYFKISKKIKRGSKSVNHIWYFNTLNKYFVLQCFWDNVGVKIYLNTFKSNEDANLFIEKQKYNIKND